MWREAKALLMLSGVIVLGLRPAHAFVADESGSRFLYVFDCSAQVVKLDTYLNQKLAVYDLAARTGRARLVPSRPNGTEACLVNQLVFVQASSIFYVVVPDEPEPKENGKYDYRVLGFTVPALKLVKYYEAGKDTMEPPAFSKAGKVLQTVEGSKDANSIPSSSLNRQSASGEMLESSGHYALIRIYTEDQQELKLGVLDKESQHLTALRDLPPTNALSAHIAPGGSAVLVEEVKPVGSRAVRVGRMVLYDSKTGERVSQYEAPQTAGQSFLAISPNGRAIYHASSAFSFVDLQKQFTAEQVMGSSSTPTAQLLFANR